MYQFKQGYWHVNVCHYLSAHIILEESIFWNLRDGVFANHMEYFKQAGMISIDNNKDLVVLGQLRQCFYVMSGWIIYTVKT